MAGSDNQDTTLTTPLLSAMCNVNSGDEEEEKSKCTKKNVIKFLAGLGIIAITVALIMIFAIKKEETATGAPTGAPTQLSDGTPVPTVSPTPAPSPLPTTPAPTPAPTTIRSTLDELLLKYFNIPCLLYTSPSPRDISGSRMPSSA